MSFTIIEQSVVGKYGDASRCEDALVITPFFAAVVDGATSKCDLSFDGKTTGRLASELLSGVIRSLPYDATMSEFIDEANRVFMDFYCRNGLRERVVSEPQCRLSASVAIYGDTRREVWTVGDCRLRIGDEMYIPEKSVDLRLAQKRAEMIERYLSQGGNLDNLIFEDVGRKTIEEDLRRQMFAQNNPSSIDAYGVIDGFTPYNPDVRCYEISVGTEVILTTDGYPYLYLTLEESERYLRMILQEDPLCFRQYKATKGKGVGQSSFDDRRTYACIRSNVRIFIDSVQGWETYYPINRLMSR